MTIEEWKNLSINDMVYFNHSPNFLLKIVEICEDERFVNQWKEKIDKNCTKILKLENENYHTWCGVMEKIQLNA